VNTNPSHPFVQYVVSKEIFFYFTKENEGVVTDSKIKRCTYQSAILNLVV
jgi:hypothetical protein